MEKNQKVHLNKNEIHDVNGGDGQCPHCHGELSPRDHGGFGPPPPPSHGHYGPPPHHGHYGPPPGGFGPQPPHQSYEQPQREKNFFEKIGDMFSNLFRPWW